MSTRTKKQHLVPRFYLNRFCDANGRVWTYSADSEPFSRRPEDTAVESNFYSPVGEEGERFDDIESALATIEGNASPLWEELLAGKVMKGKARESMAIFLAAQFLRSPTMVGAAAEAMGFMLNPIIQRVSRDTKISEETAFLRDENDDKRESADTRERVRKFFSDPNNYKIHVLREIGLQALNSVDACANVFLNMTWVVGLSRDQHLITSDSPVTRAYDPKTHHPIYGYHGFANKSLRVNFPLSPYFALELVWEGDERERIVDIPVELVREMNRLRAAQADRYVYSSQRDSGIQKLCTKWISSERKRIESMGADCPEIEIKRKIH